MAIKMIRAFLWVMIFLGSVTQHAAQTQGSVESHEDNVTPLHALIAIAMSAKVPIGIVLDEQGSLCVEKKGLTISAESFERAGEIILTGTGYSIKSSGGGGFVVLPANLSKRQQIVLGTRIAIFNPPSATMHELGVFLEGQTEMTLHPSEGFAADIPSTLSARMIRLPLLHDETVQQIANAITVVDDDKGLWIVPYLSPDDAKERRSLIEIYSYRDNRDQIAHLKCAAVSNR